MVKAYQWLKTPPKQSITAYSFHFEIWKFEIAIMYYLSFLCTISVHYVSFKYQMIRQVYSTDNFTHNLQLVDNIYNVNYEAMVNIIQFHYTVM